MSEALRAQERLHNALVRLENLMKEGVKGAPSVDYSVSEELEATRKENAKLKEAQEKAKLRLDNLIDIIELEAKG